MKRQPPGSGSIKKHGQGYRLVVIKNGKQLVGPTVEKRSEARAAFEAKYSVRRKPELFTTLKDSFQSIYGSSWWLTKSPTTRDLEKPVFERFLERYGHLALGDVTAELLMDYRATMRVAPRTANRYINALRSALTYLGQLTDRVKPLQTSEKRANWLSPEEQAEFLEFAQSFPPYLLTAVMLGLYAGLRRGEICGLCHEDRDDDGINISRNVIEGDEGLAIKRPKSAKGETWIPLHDALRPLVGHGRGLVIATSKGTPMRPRNLSRSLRTFTEGTKWEHLTFHDFRRTFSMSLLELGVDVKTASDITRHDPKVLLKEYTQSRRDLKQEAMKKLNGRYQDSTLKRRQVS